MRLKLYLPLLLLLLTSSLFSQTVQFTSCNESTPVVLTWNSASQEFKGNGTQGTYELYNTGGWMLVLPNGNLQFHSTAGTTLPPSCLAANLNGWLQNGSPCTTSQFTMYAAADVATNAVTTYSFTTATLTGDVSFAGNGPVTEKGIVYSTSSNPDLNDTKLTNGTGAGPISVSATGLTQGTTYYVRAYATNSTGTSYGAQQSFTTPAPVTVSSASAASASPTNATTVSYTVKFSTSASSVTASAFDLITTGVTGASISSVTGSGTTYTVTVNTGSGDGTIQLRVTGTGMSSVPSNVPFAGATYTIDKTPPTTTINSTPPAITNSTSIPFTFSSNETSATFEVKLDAGTFVAAGSPAILTGVTEGTHTFYVRAKDAAGNTDPTPVTYTWTVDKTPPGAPAIATIADGVDINTATPTYDGTAEANDSVTIYVDGAYAGKVLADATGYWYFNQPGTLASGAHTLYAIAMDAARNFSVASATNTFTISLLGITPATLPNGKIGNAYSQTLTGANGMMPYSFAITAGTLPAGLSMTSGGAISGTPTAAGIFNFLVKVTDGISKTATQSYSLVVNAPTISIAPTTVPTGDENVAYTTTTVTASGGISPYLYAITSGSLPTGLSLNSATGAISGTPTTNGTFNFTVTATDASTGTGPFTGSRLYTLIINSLPAITFGTLPNKTYGDADFSLTATSTNTGVPVTYTSSNTAVATITAGNKVHIIAAGNTTITASQAGDANHGAAIDVQQPLQIDAKTINVTPTATSKIYGAGDPVLSYTYAPALVGSDAFTGAITRTVGENVGAYAITQGSLKLNNNYLINYGSANLTITPAPLTITANNQTKVYGASVRTLTVSYSGWVNNDDVSSLTTLPTVGVPAGTSSPVGNYVITPSGAVSPNYTIAYVTGTLSITNAALIITADDQTKVYGANVPTLTTSYSGWVNGDNTSAITTLPVVSVMATSASAVGDYPVTASGAVVPNYTITYVQGNLSVTPATLTITAYDASKVYGDNNPALLVTYNGWVNGDDESDITTLVKVTTTATVSSPVGNYPITPSTAVAPNYTINFVPGNLSVTPAALTITADDQTKIYGANNPSLTASYNGFVNGDNASSLTTAPTITTTATSSSVVGNYSVTASGAVDANYTITYAAGNLSVTPAALTITADDQTKIYGQNNPALTVSYSGFVNNDDQSTLTTAPAITTTATAVSNVGDYTISASGAANTNYIISYVNGNLSITPAALTITAEDKTKDYGAALPTFTATYSGWVNGDGVSSLTTAPSITTTATAASNVGNYPITAANAVNANYTISYVAGNLAVNAVPLNIKAENKTKVYGDADPAMTYIATGWVNGDGTSVITGALKRITGENVSTYAINQNTLSAGNNYIITYTAGNFTITPATLTITADAQTKVYNTADPALTYVPTGWKNGDGSSVITGGLTRAAGENVGTYAIQQGTIAAGNNYTISYVGNNLIITKAPQVITWVQDLTIGCTADITPVQLNATVNSGLTISYGISSTDVATISGNSLTPVAPGYAVITASQAGDANHFAAPSVINNVNYRSASAVRQHWSEVLIFDNSSNNYTKWEWYKNSSLVSGQTSAYYSEPSALSGTYYVIATDKNGEAIQSCPLTLNGSATVTAGIKVYPNPVTAGSSATITCNYTDAALQGAKMAIVDISGKIQQEITNVKATQTITAPSARGLYYITLLLKNGAKASVNLLVN